MQTRLMRLAGFLAVGFLAGCQQHKASEVSVAPGAGTGYASEHEDLVQRTLQRRAVEAVVWGIPVVNYDAMYQAVVRDAHGGPNQLVYWSRPSDWKNQTLTPNTDALYFMPFINTKDAGPMVLEIPAAQGGTIVGSIMNCWQVALEDVGPAGADAGKGGKYLILPPDYKGKPPAGYIVLPSTNYENYALLRSMPKSTSGADIATAVGYGKKIKLYPLSSATHPDETRFIDATGIVFDANIPYDQRFFDSLNRVVQIEPWIDRDRAMIDILVSIGIEKGKPFDYAKNADGLKAGLDEGHKWLEAGYESFPPYYAGEHWFLPASPVLFKAWATGFNDPDSYPVDARGVTYYWGFSSIKRTGTGQFQQYLFSTRDKTGAFLDGTNNYRLAVPANVPVSQYWSATAYDRATHALIRDQKWASRSSLDPNLQKNADGSVDIYFGPTAPQGKESNWIPTKAGGGFELIFRCYGAQKAVFDKTWQLPDIEKSGS
jgi:hypothetical protein